MHIMKGSKKMKDLDGLSTTEIKKIFDEKGVKYEEGSIELFKEDARLVTVFHKLDIPGVAGEEAFHATFGNYNPEWVIDDKLEMAVIPFFECKRCNKKWVAKKTKSPITCPRCRSPYWDLAKADIQLELNHIPRGSLAQNMLRCYYESMRLRSLGRKATTKESKEDVLRKVLEAVKNQFPGQSLEYNKNFFKLDEA